MNNLKVKSEQEKPMDEDGNIISKIESEIRERFSAGASLARSHGAIAENKGNKELDFLNKNHNFSLNTTNPSQIKSHRAVIGSLIDAVKKRLLSLLRHRVLNNYFESEAKFNSNLVRVLNSFETKISSNKESVSQGKPENNPINLRKRIEELEASNSKLASNVSTLSSVVSGLERIVSLSSKIESSKDSTISEAFFENKSKVDFKYLLLENRFRGSEGEIKNRLSNYVDYFKNLGQEPVLEIGSGRGELLELLKEEEINCIGVELDRAMYELSKDKGLDMLYGDGLEILRSREDSSLSGLIAIQVVEHLDISTLKDLLSLARDKVKSGGRIIFETINTESLLALSHNYFRDPTHSAPLHPDTMSYLMELSGLKVIEIKKQSPYPSGALLAELDAASTSDENQRANIEVLNRNIRQLNKILYGFQDYAVIATV